MPYAAAHAAALACEIAAALDYVGVLAVEMFIVAGDLVINELAPRPHNSGHWTLDASRTSQFEQQVRAICGAGLGDASLTAPAAAMVNLLGDLWVNGEPDWSAALAHPATSTAPLRQGGAPSGAQDGPSDRDRGDPRRGRTAGEGHPGEPHGSLACARP